MRTPEQAVRGFAESLADDLLDEERRWSRHSEARFGRPSEINLGPAGAILAFAEVGPALGAERFAATLERLVSIVEDAPLQRAHPGLYVGEGGCVLALLALGRLLDRPRLVEAASARALEALDLAQPSPDIFNGLAGQARLHAILARTTGSERHAEAAVRLAETIVARAETDEAGARWRIPADHGPLSGKVQPGYAHGTAGIADALVDVLTLREHDGIRRAVVSAARWLESVSVRALPDGSGATWATEVSGEPSMVFWCHGATGIARFLLRAARVHEPARALGIAALRTVGLASRWAGPTVCHGLAGNMDVLLDGFGLTGDQAYLEEARRFHRLLARFFVEDGDRLRCSSESPWVVSPDYMVGYAGVAACVARLCRPVRSSQLSLEGMVERMGGRLQPASGIFASGAG